MKVVGALSSASFLALVVCALTALVDSTEASVPLLEAATCRSATAPEPFNVGSAVAVDATFCGAMNER